MCLFDEDSRLLPVVLMETKFYVLLNFVNFMEIAKYFYIIFKSAPQQTAFEIKRPFQILGILAMLGMFKNGQSLGLLRNFEIFLLNSQ